MTRDHPPADCDKTHVLDVGSNPVVLYRRLSDGDYKRMGELEPEGIDGWTLQGTRLRGQWLEADSFHAGES